MEGVSERISALYGSPALVASKLPHGRTVEEEGITLCSCTVSEQEINSAEVFNPVPVFAYHNTVYFLAQQPKWED